MVVLQQSIFISNSISASSHLHSNQRNVGRPMNLIVSKKEEQVAKSQPEKTQQGGDLKQANFPIKKVAAQVGIGLLTLGFIDAGYSGDWSRIGVISKENEDLLKAAAFVVVPICVYLIYVISQELDDN